MNPAQYAALVLESSELCGTNAGYERHRRRFEVTCRACCAAHAAYNQARAAAGEPPRPLLPCGTVAAWRRHMRSGQRPCPACREAKRAESAANRARRAAA